MKKAEIIDTTLDNLGRFGLCGYKNPKKEGFPEKAEWLGLRFKEGLKIKTLYSEEDGAQGMIEYVPGEKCWRPVYARGYMFIHCLFTGFKKEYKGHGYGSRLIEECLLDAKMYDMLGAAVVTRKGSFMSGSEIFLKNGFEVVDSAPPDFELLVKKFKKSHPNPKFKRNWEHIPDKYSDGLFIIRADQCPYTIKNVKEIAQAAADDFGITANIIDLETAEEAQESPCPFGIFCIIYNGAIIADHPVSATRFKNIISGLLNPKKKAAPKKKLQKA
ncbi:MAG TPA: YoaP domain-containing protein [Ignavibacteriales bacterium]|nr:YoaP domain-containing protein [Ignavibacteriales bacterium]